MIPFPMAFNQSCYGLRAKETIVDPVFLYYLVKHNVYVLKKNTHGSVFDTITRATFDGITVDIPEKTIQIKIANFLSLLDDKIELNTQINNNLYVQISKSETSSSPDISFVNNTSRSSNNRLFSSERIVICVIRGTTVLLYELSLFLFGRTIDILPSDIGFIKTYFIDKESNDLVFENK